MLLVTLNEALWAYRMACHGSTKFTLYQLVYGHDVVLPWEIKTGSRCVAFQEDLTADDYKSLMNVRALENIKANKLRIAKHYDKKVKLKEFHERELVWELVLPIGSKDNKYSKWSPNWEGPYRVSRCIPGNAYILETLEGETYPKVLNGKYLKKYYSSIWVDA